MYRYFSLTANRGRDEGIVDVGVVWIKENLEVALCQGQRFLDFLRFLMFLGAHGEDAEQRSERPFRMSRRVWVFITLLAAGEHYCHNWVPAALRPSPG